MVPDCNTNFRNGFTALDNPYKVVLDDSLVLLDEKSNILAAILAASLYSGDRIATPTSGMVLQPLITHSPVDIRRYFGGHLGLWYRIATPTSGMVLQPLITHTKWY